MHPIDFIKIAVKDYKKVGSVTVSSQYTIRRIVKEIKPGYKYVVDYGAGNGVVVREILKVLPPDGKVVALELNHDLFEALSKIDDPRLIPVKDDVINLSKKLSSLGLPRIDMVISSIPLSFLKDAERKELIKNTYDSLTAGGRLVVYQYSLLILPVLKKLFHKVRYRLELRNVPPYFVMVGEKS